MNLKTPTIIIRGTVGSGKSSMAYAIKHALAEHGIAVDVPLEDENPEEMEKNWRRNLNCLSGRTVEVEIEQAAADALVETTTDKK